MLYLVLLTMGYRWCCLSKGQARVVHGNAGVMQVVVQCLWIAWEHNVVVAKILYA